MQQSGPTEIAVSRLKGGTSVTQLLHEANGPPLATTFSSFCVKRPVPSRPSRGLRD